MASQKVRFRNATGYELSAKLEFPVNQHPHTFAVFAHCFTCNKNLAAVRNISRALNMEGFAVLRFDFTGLGDSEGDFADTNFTSNVLDLIAAAEFLQQEYTAPAIMIGHSLGGAAALCAGSQVDSIKAIATIGAPSDPEHLSHLLEGNIEEIENTGEAYVTISGRKFKVKQQFLEDIREQSIGEHLQKLRKALLIMHSPQDEVVAIDHAANLYTNAFHPKSFITLDGADHLLSNKADSLYAGNMIANWAKRYIDLPEKEKLNSDKQVAVRLGAKGYTTEVMVRKHSLTADEPESVGGNDFGPSPYELVAAGLGACTAMTLHMYARRKKWPLDEVVVHLQHYKDYAEDALGTDKKPSQIDFFDRLIEIEGNLDDSQLQRLLEIADRCPVHRTLHNPVEIKTALKEE